MTARDRLLALRRALVRTIALRAAFAGVAIAAGEVAAARAFALPAGAAVTGALVGIALGLLLAIELRAARSVERVALWVEERHPALRWALVAAAESQGDSRLEQQALAQPWWDDEHRRLARLLVAPAVWLVVAIGVAVWHPVLVSRATARAAARIGGTSTNRIGVDPLAALRVVVTPPAYANRPTTTLDDPSSLSALPGSLVTVEGAGDAASVGATLDSAAIRVAPSEGGWRARVGMPAAPALVHLRAGARERLLLLAPVADAPPVVTLLLPARDTVVRVAHGTLTLQARLRDDVGLRDADFEIIVSSGQDESFTFRSTTLARRQLDGRTDAELGARLSLDSLALKPGDVVQLRAVARDGNTVGGPGIGSSETRALRVARAGEYDSVAVEGAPPGEPEGQVLSQRMLITLTEALDKRRARLPRPLLLDESRRIAADQTRLRKRVGDVVFQRMGSDPLAEESTLEEKGKLTPEDLLAAASRATGANAGAVMDVEGDETPILAVNKPLLEAFNAMWDAGRALEQGDTRLALPPMRRALAAIERARQAERVYLRGRPAAVIVDVGHARLAGKDKGVPTVREPRAPASDVARRRARTFERATALLGRDRAAAADSLLVLRVSALGDDPTLAAALDDAARAARCGSINEIARAWTRLRRALGGAPVTRAGIAEWSGAP